MAFQQHKETQMPGSSRPQSHTSHTADMCAKSEHESTVMFHIGKNRELLLHFLFMLNINAIISMSTVKKKKA
jgi:hypothetical protein